MALSISGVGDLDGVEPIWCLWRAIDILWFSVSCIYFPAIPSFFSLLLVQTCFDDLSHVYLDSAPGFFFTFSFSMV
jgi:hypothetical protein